MVLWAVWVQSINMQRKSNFLNSQTMPAKASSVRGIRAKIANLNQERDRLEEEVGQLRVAVQIYTEVVRRWALAARGQDSPDARRVD